MQPEQSNNPTSSSSVRPSPVVEQLNNDSIFDPLRVPSEIASLPARSVSIDEPGYVSDKEIAIHLGRAASVKHWIYAHLPLRATLPARRESLAVPFEKLCFAGAPRDYVSPDFDYQYLYCGTLQPSHPNYKELKRKVADLIATEFRREAWVLLALGANPALLCDPSGKGFLQEWKRVNSDPELGNLAYKMCYRVASYSLSHGEVFVASKADLASNHDPENILAAVNISIPHRQTSKEIRQGTARYCVAVIGPAKRGDYGPFAFEVLRHRALLGLYAKDTEITAGLLATKENIPTRVPGLSEGKGIGGQFLRHVFRKVFELHPEFDSITGYGSLWTVSDGKLLDKKELYTKRLKGRADPDPWNMCGLQGWRYEFSRQYFTK